MDFFENKKLYDSNPNFRNYVNKQAKMSNTSIEDALTFRVCTMYREYLESNNGCEYPTETFFEKIEPEDKCC